MTRLVGVHAVCDGCSAAAATVFCVSHRNVLCPSCNTAQHSNPSTASHQRVDLSSAVTALPFCEHCDDAPATTYCESESSTFCDKCDTIVHEAVEVPHWRTPIERTLRSRAVEFRVSSRPRQTGRPRPSMSADTNPSHHHQPSSPEKRQNGKDPPKPKAKSPDRKPPPSGPSAAHQWSQPTHNVSTHPIPTLTSPSASKQPRGTKSESRASPRRKVSSPTTTLASPSALPPRHSTTQKRRPRPLAKRKRDMQRLSQQQQPVRPLDLPFSRANVVPTPTDEFFSYQPGTRTSQPMSYGLPTSLPTPHSQHQPLQEPLMTDAASRFLDLDMLPYESLDLSGEATAVEGINGSGRSASASASAGDSGDSSRRKTPDIEMLPSGAQIAHAPPTPAEVVASAVVAGGEQYLLNSVSTGSGSSRERESPPGDLPGGIDPASELVAVANAAAASAVAQAAAGGGLNNQPLKTMSAPIATETMGDSIGGRMRQPRITRRMSEPGIPTARDMAKVEAARDAISDEAMRRLEIENRRAKHEDFMHADSMSCDRTEGNTDQLVAQMSDGDDVLRRGEDMGYLEIPRDDFGGVFDPIDLSQFDQNSSGGLGFGAGDFRPTLDSDEG